MLMHPWIMVDTCHADASCHLGVTRTTYLRQSFYWWPGMDHCTHPLVGARCFTCQARKTSRQTVRWSTLTLLPLTNDPGELVSCDYLGLLPLSPRCNLHFIV